MSAHVHTHAGSEIKHEVPPCSALLYLRVSHCSLQPYRRPSVMANSGLQIGGFLLGLIGVAAVIAATVMNNWSTQDRQGDVVTAVYTYKGLWQDCEVSTSGFTECRPLYGLLGYSGGLKRIKCQK